MKSIKTYEEFNFKNIFSKKETKPPSTYDKLITRRMDMDLLKIIDECFSDLKNLGFFIQINYNSPGFEVQIVKDNMYANKVYYSVTKNYDKVIKFKINEIINLLLKYIKLFKTEYNLTVSNVKIYEYDYEKNDLIEKVAKDIKSLNRNQINKDILSIKIYLERL